MKNLDKWPDSAAALAAWRVSGTGTFEDWLERDCMPDGSPSPAVVADRCARMDCSPAEMCLAAETDFRRRCAMSASTAGTCADCVLHGRFPDRAGRDRCFSAWLLLPSPELRKSRQGADA